MPLAEGLVAAAEMAETASAAHRMAGEHEAARAMAGLAHVLRARAGEEDTDPGVTPLRDVQERWWRRLREWLNSH